VTSSELAQEVVSIVETKLRSTPSASEFEMAYQARVAIEKIRFAIKELARLGGSETVALEVGLQLTDALERLEAADRRSQGRFNLGRTPAAQENRKGGNSAHVSPNRAYAEDV
jgi:hypothetical protein